MKPKTTPKLRRNFNSEKFWRHYVATEAPDAGMFDEEKKGGHASRIFIFLLLLHAFLIGSVVLYNLVAERPRPAFVDGTAPSKKSAEPAKDGVVAPIQSKTVEYVVVTGDSLKSIADKTGATPEEIVLLNGLDRGGSISVGKKLLVPDRTPQAPTAPQVAQPQPQTPPVKAEPVVAVQSTTKPGVSQSFQAAEPPASPPKQSSAPPVSQTPPEKVEAVAQKRPAPEPKKADPTPVKKTSEDAPPPVKVAEHRPVAKAEPKPAPKPEPKKAEPTVAKTPAKSAPAKSSGGSHTVKSGDTFYSISRKYGVSADQMMRYNGIKDASKLRIGAVLKVPPKG